MKPEVPMKTKQEILSIIKAHQDVLRQRFKVKEIDVFGSVVREEQREASDIDSSRGFRAKR